MKHLMWTLLPLLALAIAGPGCATGRWADLRDCGKLSVGYGFGVGVDAGFGALTHPSIGLFSLSMQSGLENRDVFGFWENENVYFPLADAAEAGSKESPHLRSYKSIKVFRDGSVIKTCTFHGRWLNFLGNPYPDDSLLKGATDFEAGAGLPAVCVRIGVDPLEFVDFLFGFMGLDIMNDDYPTVPNANTCLEPESSS
jgi:hypothetical protein